MLHQTLYKNLKNFPGDFSRLLEFLSTPLRKNNNLPQPMQLKIFHQVYE